MQPPFTSGRRRTLPNARLPRNLSLIHIFLACMSENTTKTRNIKQYLRAVLFNAPSTMNSYYTSLVAHDMASGALAPKKPQFGDPDYYSCNEGESL